MRCSTKDFLEMLKKVTKISIARTNLVSLAKIHLTLTLVRAVKIHKEISK